MRVTSLASGSSGNALAIEHDGQALLVDAGCQPRRLTQLLDQAGVQPLTLAAVLISHEHSDHVAGLGAIPRHVPLVMTPGTRAAAPRLNGESAFFGRNVVEQPCGSTRDVGPFRVSSFPVSHDGAEVCGYLVEAGGRRVAVFTDLGSVATSPTSPAPGSSARCCRASAARSGWRTSRAPTTARRSPAAR